MHRTSRGRRWLWEFSAFTEPQHSALNGLERYRVPQKVEIWMDAYRSWDETHLSVGVFVLDHQLS